MVATTQHSHGTSNEEGLEISNKKEF